MRITPVYIYLIGQIKGLPIEEAKRNFQNIESKLRALGYSPVNPFNWAFLSILNTSNRGHII